MNFTRTTIPDVIVLEPRVFGDHRGFFMETWRKSWFSKLVSTQPGLAPIPNRDFVQDNHSRSSRGILRGLHYQLNQPQGKLVRAIDGEIFDVAVDMRRRSSTFGRSVGVVLSAENKRQLWVPPGFAHGFYVTSDTAEITYKCTDYYAPQDEHSLLWNDPALAIAWPLQGEQPVLSEKDKNGLLFGDAVKYE